MRLCVSNFSLLYSFLENQGYVSSLAALIVFNLESSGMFYRDEIIVIDGNIKSFLVSPFNHIISLVSYSGYHPHLFLSSSEGFGRGLSKVAANRELPFGLRQISFFES